MTNKIIMVRGDTQNIDVLITNEDGTNHLVTDKETCLFTVKKSYADERILIEKDVKSNGTVNTFKLDPIDTSSMDFGGYCYDIALQEATRIILVSDGKIASTNHLLHKIGQLKDDSRVSVIINRIDTRHNETEFDDVNIIRSKFDKDRIIELPVDKHLLNETKEMAVKHNKKIDRELNRYFVNAVPDIKNKRK